MYFVQLTDFQKRIYNVYLGAVAKASNRPYKERKNFDKIDNATFQALRVLEMRFVKNKFIDIPKYFDVFLQYMGAEYLPIEQFVRQKAFLVYMKLVRSVELADGVEDEGFYVDITESELEDFKKGLKFIAEFTKSQGKKMNEYCQMINEAYVPYYMIHLQKHDISMFHLHMFGLGLFEIPKDYCELIMPNFVENFLESQREFEKSKILREYRDKLTKKFLEHD